MKKILLILLVLIIVAGGVWYFVFNKTKDETADLKTYTNTKLGFEFKYPSKIIVTEKSQEIILSHSVPYRHVNFCDLKDGSWDDNFIDYSSRIQVFNENYVSAVKKKYGSINSMVDGVMDTNGNLSKGNVFVAKSIMGEFDVYEYFIGAEGCGQHIYVIPVENKTIFIERDLIPPFVFDAPYNGPFSDESIEEFRNIQGVILPEANNLIFDQILSTFKFTEVNGQECANDLECREIVCSGGGFVHEQCIDNKCVLGLDAKCPK
jgi:hypothetical protein